MKRRHSPTASIDLSHIFARRRSVSESGLAYRLKKSRDSPTRIPNFNEKLADSENDYQPQPQRPSARM